MVMVYTQDIVRKHDLIRKGNLSKEEEKELKDIQDYIDGINKELLELQSKGFVLVNGRKFAKEEAAVMTPEKEHLTIQERKDKAKEIIKVEIAKGKNDKDIIKTLCTLLGVSNTYAYQSIKNYKLEA